MALTIGIVGLPNAGKSTLFNALTRNDVLAANYPFATIEPNVGVVGVPDGRLDVLAGIFGSAKTLPATVQFVDIAGIVRGASEGEGLGNKFLSHIRESDAICQVTRVFRDEDVTHVDGEVNPASRHLHDPDRDDPGRPADGGEGDPAAGEGGARQQGAGRRPSTQPRRRWRRWRPAPRSSPPRSTAPLVRELSLLTAKPYIYVFNCDADELADEALKQQMRDLVAPAEAIFLDAKFESELVELDDDDEAREMLARDGRRGARASTCSPGSASTPSACRPTSPPAPRSRAPGRSARAPPPPRPPASSTPTSRRASSRPRSSPTTTWSPPARCSRPRRPARSAWRARTT